MQYSAGIPVAPAAPETPLQTILMQFVSTRPKFQVELIQKFKDNPLFMRIESKSKRLHKKFIMVNTNFQKMLQLQNKLRFQFRNKVLTDTVIDEDQKSFSTHPNFLTPTHFVKSLRDFNSLTQNFVFVVQYDISK